MKLNKIILKLKINYVPQNISEAVTYLRNAINFGENQTFLSIPATHLHNTLGKWIREHWMKDKNSLCTEFVGYGIFHTDDMSGIILAILRRNLLGQLPDFLDLVGDYRNWWKKNGFDPDNLTTLNQDTAGPTRFEIKTNYDADGEFDEIEKIIDDPDFPDNEVAVSLEIVEFQAPDPKMDDLAAARQLAVGNKGVVTDQNTDWFELKYKDDNYNYIIRRRDGVFESKAKLKTGGDYWGPCSPAQFWPAAFKDLAEKTLTGWIDLMYYGVFYKVRNNNERLEAAHLVSNIWKFPYEEEWIQDVKLWTQDFKLTVHEALEKYKYASPIPNELCVDAKQLDIFLLRK